MNSPIICQSVAEYGGILAGIASVVHWVQVYTDGIVAWITRIFDRVEVYVGRGNLKYVLAAVLVLIVVFLLKRRKRSIL